jgi:hypothetical protein
MTDALVERASSWAETASIVLGSLAAIAVVLAWWFSSKDADRKEAVLERYKEDARVAVAKADARAGEANEAAGKANEEAAKANERAATLEKEAASLKLELAKLKERQQPRVLTPEQKAKFKQFTTSFAKGRIVITALTGERGEPRTYAGELKALLEEAGYQVEPSVTTFIVSGGDELSGLWLKVTDIDSAPPHAGPLQKAFEAIGIKATGTNTKDSAVDQNTVMIAVYKKDWPE